MFSHFILVCIAISFFAALANAANYDEQIKKNLDSAKANRSELEKAIAYFEKKGDPQQLDAVKFLIANMDGSVYCEFAIFDTNKKEIPFRVLDYPNFDSAQKALNAIEKKVGGVNFDRKQLLKDLETVKADFLIKNVELAFKAWKSKPWAKHISYEVFRDYILPYRDNIEPIEEFRSYFIDRYPDLAKSMKDSTDPVEAAAVINTELKKIFTFDSRYYLHPTDQGLAEMLQTHLGRCGDMTNLTVEAMRANAIPVMSDYTPYWANTGNNHAWNAVMDRSGKAVPFMGCEADPYKYKLFNIPAKAYRKMYPHQRNCLSSMLTKNERAPGWLGGDKYIDVTRDYTTVSDVTLPLTDTTPDSVRFAYLCVFNSGEWKPIHWATLKGKSALFSDMGRNVMYTPAFFYKKKTAKKDSLAKADLEMTGDAFILKSDGTMRFEENDG